MGRANKKLWRKEEGRQERKNKEGWGEYEERGNPKLGKEEQEKMEDQWKGQEGGAARDLRWPEEVTKDRKPTILLFG